MKLPIRQMQPKDAEQLLSIYQQFALNFVGSATRNLKTFQGIARKRDNLRWVALNEQEKIIGYILATYAKGRKTGRIGEIVVTPDHEFETVAKPLFDKVYSVLLEKGTATIYADTIRNPYYPRLFGKLGFFEVEADGVFMFAVTDAAKFLDEITPILTARLKQAHDWNGLLQITCKEDSRFFKKQDENVQPIVATNYRPDCKISLNASTLADVLLGRVDAQRAWTDGIIEAETRLSKDGISRLLAVLFPKKQFLALDYW